MKCSRCGATTKEEPSCGKSIHDLLPSSKTQTRMKRAYRLYTDEPLGFAIGFKPAWAVTADSITLEADDGGKNAFIINSRLVISKKKTIAGQYPEPDALIFRTKREYEEWAKENEDEI